MCLLLQITSLKGACREPYIPLQIFIRAKKSFLCLIKLIPGLDSRIYVVFRLHVSSNQKNLYFSFFSDILAERQFYIKKIKFVYQIDNLINSSRIFVKKSFENFWFKSVNWHPFILFRYFVFFPFCRQPSWLLLHQFYGVSTLQNWNSWKSGLIHLIKKKVFFKNSFPFFFTRFLFDGNLANILISVVVEIFYARRNHIICSPCLI